MKRRSLFKSLLALVVTPKVVAKKPEPHSFARKVGEFGFSNAGGRITATAGGGGGAGCPFTYVDQAQRDELQRMFRDMNKDSLKLEIIRTLHPW